MYGGLLARLIDVGGGYSWLSWNERRSCVHDCSEGGFGNPCFASYPISATGMCSLPQVLMTPCARDQNRDPTYVPAANGTISVTAILVARDRISLVSGMSEGDQEAARSKSNISILVISRIFSDAYRLPIPAATALGPYLMKAGPPGARARREGIPVAPITLLTPASAPGRMADAANIVAMERGAFLTL